MPPPGSEGRPFARGIWDGDELPELDLADGYKAPAVSLKLEPMPLGRSASMAPSWVERMTSLRDDPQLGLFRLAYLGVIV